MRGALTGKKGAHAPSRVVLGALAEDGVEISDRGYSNRNLSPTTAPSHFRRVPEIQGEGAWERLKNYFGHLDRLREGEAVTA